MPVDQRSPYLHLPLPHQDNRLEQDLPRLRTAFGKVDSHAQNTDSSLGELGARTQSALASLESLKADLEARGAELQQAQAESAARLAGHMAEENPHHIPLADGQRAGLVRSGNGVEVQGGVISVPPAPERYELCEPYFFLNPTLRPGFQPAQGGLLENAATLYPQAWAFLQSSEGRHLCTSEAEWQAMSTAVWATLADGTQVGWNGIGGAPRYALHPDTGALRLPDLRGMYAEAAGFDSLGVGGVHGDAIRDVTGSFCSWGGDSTASGVIAANGFIGTYLAVGGNQGIHYKIFRMSRSSPVGNKISPRAWGALACVYLGQPAS